MTIPGLNFYFLMVREFRSIKDVILIIAVFVIGYPVMLPAGSVFLA